MKATDWHIFGEEFAKRHEVTSSVTSANRDGIAYLFMQRRDGRTLVLEIDPAQNAALVTKLARANNRFEQARVRDSMQVALALERLREDYARQVEYLSCEVWPDKKRMERAHETRGKIAALSWALGIKTITALAEL